MENKDQDRMVHFSCWLQQSTYFQTSMDFRKLYDREDTAQAIQ